MCSCRASSEAAPPRVLQLVLSAVQPPHTRPSSTMPRPQMSPAGHGGLAQKCTTTYAYAITEMAAERAVPRTAPKLHTMPAELSGFRHVLDHEFAFND